MLNCRQIFAHTGLRHTKQRCAILSALAISDLHPTAEELFDMVSSDANCEGISLATVYNTLETLCDANICMRLTLAGGSARYDVNLHRWKTAAGRTEFQFDPDRSPHLHVLDEDSGDILDVPDGLSEDLMGRIPPALVQQIEEAMGVEISRISVHLVGRQIQEAALAVSSSH